MNNCLGVHFKIIPRPFDLSEIKGCDIVHLNYEAGLFAPVFSSDTFLRLQQAGYKTVMTLHTSHDGNNERTGKILGFDKVVVHEKTQDNCIQIPMGIPIERPRTTPSDTPTIGTFGFPFPWKGFTEVVLACRQLQMRALVIAPESPHADTYGMQKHLQSLYDDVEYMTGYMSQREIIDVLGTCRATAFAYHGGNYGISAACRLGLATGRPTVLSRSRQFRDLFDYEDELYFVNAGNVGQLVQSLENALGPNNKRPKRLLKEMNWTKAGGMYRELYQSLLGEK